MATEYRSLFNIGLFDPNIDDCWPWEYHCDEGQYLSEKKRLCGWSKAAVFDSIDEARTFFTEWKGSQKWKMHIVEYKTYVTVPDPIYPSDHPETILKAINKSERHNVWLTAYLWFRGEVSEHYLSKQTLKKHRTKLLAYGIDIFTEPTTIYVPEKMKVDNVFHTAKPELSVIK